MGVAEGTSAVRNRLIDAAGGFASQGYVEFSVAQILARAGVQAPTLYHHFGDKEGLFVAWAMTAIARMEPALNGEPLEASLRRVTLAVLDPANPDLIQLARDSQKLDRAESREQVQEALQRTLYEPLYAVLLEGMAQSRLRREPIHAAASVFLTGAAALRPGGLLAGMGSAVGPEWWVEKFLAGFGL